MTTANLTLHSQRSSNPGATEESTGQVFAGVDVDAPLNSALRFAPPSDIAGATITSVTLTIRAKHVEVTGGVLCKFALAANANNLASQNLASTTETNHDFLHTPTYALLTTPPAGSVEVLNSYASYSIDLTDTANVANLEDDIIVLCQYEAFQRFTGSDDTAHITFDGVGETTPASLEIVYTPVAADASTGGLDATEADDTLSATATLAIDADAAITEAADTLSATGQLHATTGNVSLTESADTLSAAGTIPNAGSATPTEAADVLAATGSILTTGTLTVTEADDTLASTADNFKPSGFAQITEADDTLASTGESSRTAVATITEADDVVASTGSNFVTAGNAAILEAPDVLSSTGSILTTAVAEITEAGDTVISSGKRTATGRRGGFFSGRVFKQSPARKSNVFLGV